MHVQQAINASKQKRLKKAYEKLVGTKKECTSKLGEARLNFEISQGKVEEDFAKAKLVKAVQEAHKNAKESVVSVTN